MPPPTERRNKEDGKKARVATPQGQAAEQRELTELARPRPGTCAFPVPSFLFSCWLHLFARFLDDARKVSLVHSVGWMVIRLVAHPTGLILRDLPGADLGSLSYGTERECRLHLETDELERDLGTGLPY